MVGDVLASYLAKSATRKELLVMQIIDSAGNCGMVGADILNHSDGRLKRGTIYGLLERIEDKGLIDSKQVNKNKRRYPQWQYQLTDHGHKMLEKVKSGLLDSLVTTTV